MEKTKDGLDRDAIFGIGMSMFVIEWVRQDFGRRRGIEIALRNEDVAQSMVRTRIRKLRVNQNTATTIRTLDV